MMYQKSEGCCLVGVVLAHFFLMWKCLQLLNLALFKHVIKMNLNLYIGSWYLSIYC